MTTTHDSDFTIGDKDLTDDNPVNTDPLGLDVRAHDLKTKTEEELNEKTEEPITLASLTSGIHEAKEILDLINLIKSTGKQDADDLWQPIPDSDFPWSSRLVDEIFQLGDDIRAKAADIVIDGKPCRQYHGNDEDYITVNSSMRMTSSSSEENTDPAAHAAGCLTRARRQTSVGREE